MEDCSFWGPWLEGHFLTPCFRERYLNTAVLISLVIFSFTTLFFKSIRCYKKSTTTAQYKPINQHTNAFYGATETPSDQDNDDTSSTNTIVPSEFASGQPWSAYNWMRLLLSGTQLGFLVYMALSLNESSMDTVVEGRYNDLIHMYYARIVFWAYAVLLAVLNICLSFTISGKSLSDHMCTHLNYLYMADFFVQLVNLSAYYQVHDVLEISHRYEHEMLYGIITLLLLVIVSNESRYAPSEPIIADTGRVMSGETWASFYSQFMFSWVSPMLEKGNHHTLNDDDLLELIPEKRAKNTLTLYRQQKRLSMALKLLSTFKTALTIQFFYCIGWSVLMFGPPYFLNKIIKFIELGSDTNGGGEQGETVSSAFIYVLCLFLTSSGQSLCYQQALYIGRSLGIQIQSVVIGEVYSKSLRRRDEEGSSNSGNSDTAAKLEKPKVNVNNLLSVDAQKLGDLIAYVFYIYCFPIQITICIWSLYKLLGSASLWGVLIICLSQPVTFALSRHFQKLQHAAMKCTDKRIGLMNELLSAIRIVKFFAWEKQFRTRVMEARDAELKVIRARLLSYMWIGNVWFIIPVLIMVAVFYAYTRVYILTASTAFTALALFNNFKTTLDELPLITSFILQANVSLNRIETFLAEQEVKLPAPNTTSSTHIGFIDNASFSWNASSNKQENEPAAVPQIKNLNLSFPLNQMSIVCGPTGSGKTTLLLSLLGETYCLSGAAILPRKVPTSSYEANGGGAVSGIAYVAQTAWLQNCSIRDNILFGLPYDKQRYENILYMTALTRDLEILEFGDATEVGEKGITLSGGQKQRVAIARAVYSQADIVILDDCLSAVDAHTAKHLYQHCLMGEYMRHRTVILVTHHVGLCIRGAAYVVALEESGTVAAAGKPLEVIQSGALGNEFSQEGYMEEIDANEEAATDGPIPTVPKQVASHNDESADGTTAGKLVQEETRAEGSVKWAVYGTYYYASGGFLFWASVLLFFCCAQASTLGQDYWIKVWSAAYDTIANITTTAQQHQDNSRILSAFAYLGQAGSAGKFELAHKLHYMVPESVKAFAQEIQDGTAVDVAYYLGIYFLIGMLSLGLTTMRLLILFLGSLRASRTIHSQLLDRILRAKVRFFDVTPLGRIVNRFSSDLETVDQALAPSLSYLLYSIIATIYVIVLVSVITPAFIVPGFFVALMFRSVGAYYLKTSRDMKRLNSVSRSPIYVQFNETVMGVATIRAFGCQGRFTEENYSRIDANNRPFLWMWATNRWLHCRVDVLGAFVSLCTGAVLVGSRDWINPGLAGLSLSYALTFTHHVLWVVRMYAINEMNMNAIERIHEYLDIEEEPPAHIAATSPRISWPEMGTVQVQGLVMKYAPDTPAVLRNVSFETRPREKIGIVGRTGSGKSTLAMSLFRFMEPTSGRILIDGVDIHSIGLSDLRSKLTIIPQDPVLFSGTLRSNLDPFGQYDDAVLWAALKRSHLIDGQEQQQQQQQQQRESTHPLDSSSSSIHNENMITLDSPVTGSGSNWSQGQRQLIALARALVKKTSLIVLDEATSSVDFDTDHQIQETIRKEFTDSTLLCIAHRIRTVADYDRILVLDHGEVKEFDTPYALMTRDGSIFQQMCERSGEYAELLGIAEAKFKGR